MCRAGDGNHCTRPDEVGLTDGRGQTEWDSSLRALTTPTRHRFEVERRAIVTRSRPPPTRAATVPMPRHFAFPVLRSVSKIRPRPRRSRCRLIRSQMNSRRNSCDCLRTDVRTSRSTQGRHSPLRERPVGAFFFDQSGRFEKLSFS